MRTKKNLKKHELIGLKVEVIESRNPTQVGIRGRVIDETEKTIKIESKGKEKIIPKSGTVFRFILPNREKVKIKGDEISYRPEERIRKAKVKK